MPLPTSRNTDYSASTQVKSADLNDLQDQVIAAHVDGPHGDRTVVIPMASGIAGTTPLTYALNRWGQGDGAGSVDLPITLRVGDRIKSVSIRARDNGSNTKSLKLWRRSGDTSSEAQIGSTQTSDASSSYQTLTVSGLTETITDLVTYRIEALNDDAVNTNSPIVRAWVTYDHP